MTLDRTSESGHRRGDAGQGQVRLGALRMAKAALMNHEVEKGKALDDGESQQVMASLIKQRRDSIEQFTKGGRDDLADKERPRSPSSKAYLPPLDPAELERMVDEAIAETGAARPKDLGQGDEGGDAQARRTDRRRASWSTSSCAGSSGESRRMPQTFRRGPSNHFERHAQASHPSSIRLLPQAGAFFCARCCPLSNTAPARPSAFGRRPGPCAAVMLPFLRPFRSSTMSSRLARSAGLISIATMASRLLGVAREIVLARSSARATAMDAFNVAFRVPNLVRDLFAEGAMTAAFVPTFTRTLSARGREAPGGSATSSSTRCWS